MPYCSGGRSDFLIDRHEGDVRVTVQATPDDDWYSVQDAQYTTYRRADWDKAIYSRRDDTVRLPKAAFWRDKRGRIAADPKDDGHSRDCQFIQVPYASTLAEAFASAEYLERCERGDIGVYDLFARVYVDGVEVGSAVCGGFDTDHSTEGDRYIRMSARDMAHEAIREAREWLNRRKEKASA